MCFAFSCIPDFAKTNTVMNWTSHLLYTPYVDLFCIYLGPVRNSASLLHTPKFIDQCPRQVFLRTHHSSQVVGIVFSKKKNTYTLTLDKRSGTLTHPNKELWWMQWLRSVCDKRLSYCTHWYSLPAPFTHIITQSLCVITDYFFLWTNMTSTETRWDLKIYFFILKFILIGMA